MATVMQSKLPKRKPSVLKRARQTERRTEINKHNRTQLRTQIRKFREAVADGNAETVTGLYRPTMRMIDRMVQKTILHPNTAARYKSRLTRHYNQVVKKAA